MRFSVYLSLRMCCGTKEDRDTNASTRTTLALSLSLSLSLSSYARQYRSDIRDDGARRTFAGEERHQAVPKSWAAVVGLMVHVSSSAARLVNGVPSRCFTDYAHFNPEFPARTLPKVEQGTTRERQRRRAKPRRTLPLATWNVSRLATRSVMKTADTVRSTAT